MNKAGLGPGEQEMIKKEILHREAMINREGYFIILNLTDELRCLFVISSL
jgi:hypothetical protein